MSDDFDDIGDGFFPTDEVAPEDKPLGLLIPPTGRIIMNAAGEIIFDEIAELERRYRAAGGQRVTFDDSEEEAG